MARAVPQWLTHTGKGAGSCSFHKADCPSSPNLTLEAWRIPGELMVFSLHEKPEESGSDISEGNAAAAAAGSGLWL